MFAKDLRHAVVSLRRTPAFTLTAWIVLTLAIAATTAIVSVINGVLLQPLPFADEQRVIRIWSSRQDRDLPFFSVSMPDYADWRARTRTMSSIAAYERQQTATLSAGASVEAITITRVTPELFPLLGVAPTIGRGFAQTDGSDAVISYGFWQRHFGGRSDVLGQTLLVDGEVSTIVGVMPERFAVPNAPSDVWTLLPRAIDPAQRDRRDLRVLGRLAPGQTFDAAQRELLQIASVLSDEYPSSNRLWSVTVRPIVETVVGPELRRSLWLLSGAVLFVLLIACANVTSLLLTRAVARGREMAIRHALGAGRGRLIRLLLTESLVLAAAAGVSGVLLAVWAIDLLTRLGSASIPRIGEVVLDVPVLASAALVTLMTSILFGVGPALVASRGSAVGLGSRGSASDFRASYSRDLLVIAEVALAVVLLVGAGLMVRSFVRIQQRELGFDPAALLTVQLAPQPQTDSLVASTERMIASIAAMPGVVAVAGGSRLPFGGPNSANTFEIADAPVAADSRSDTDYRVVTSDYFRAVGIPLVRGRTFASSDTPGVPVAIISASMAKQYWPDRDPLGARVRLGSSPWMTVIGIAGDARYRSLDESGEPSRPMMYIPHGQRPSEPMMLAIRASIDPSDMAASVRTTLRQVTPENPVMSLQSMSTMLDTELGPQRFSTTLLGVFAALAGVLAAAGLYGLIAYLVGRRTKEIGVRMALGASPRDVMRTTAGHGVALSVVGLVIGIGGAWLLTRFLSQILFEVSPVDPATYVAVTTGFLAVTALASYLPARRALRINPIHALRAE